MTEGVILMHINCCQQRNSVSSHCRPFAACALNNTVWNLSIVFDLARCFCLAGAVEIELKFVNFQEAQLVE